MRVRITKALSGSIDGIQLTRLFKGQVYDVNTSLACYLLSEQVAELAPSDAPSVAPVEHQMFRSSEPPASPKGLPPPRAIAADRPPKKKR